MAVTTDLGGTGIWSSYFRMGERGARIDAATELEALGYTAIWMPDAGGDVFGDAADLLGGTSRVTIATGILNLWMHTAQDVANGIADFDARFPGRFLLGIGVSHSVLIDRKEPGRYREPLTKMGAYLDDLDVATPPVAADQRVLAALGPRMLELARDRARGVHPYLVNPDHTHRAREILGDAPLLLPEQAVVLERDASQAREIARQHLSHYITVENYSKNLRRLGFGENDFADGGSDRLVDSIVAWGDDAAISARVREHFAAGANHVCVQVLTLAPTEAPREQWRALAPALVGG